MSRARGRSGRRLKAAVVAALAVAAVFGGLIAATQIFGSPSIRLTPSVSLSGNPVTMEVVPPGLIVKDGMFHLNSISFAPVDNPSASTTIGNVTGLTAMHTFRTPGNYTITASYTDRGTAGSVSSTLTVLPANFSAGALRYGEEHQYLARNASMLLSNPYGILSIPVGGSFSAIRLNVISLYLSFTSYLNESISNGSFGVIDGLSAVNEAYAINSTLQIRGTGYANVLVQGFGLNLTAALNVSASSSLYNSLSTNSTLAQADSLTGGISLGYLGSTLYLGAGTSSLDSFTSLSPGTAVNLLFQQMVRNGSFHMPETQARTYVSGVPAQLSMNLSGTSNGYSWKTGPYIPSVGTSRLWVDFQIQPNTTYTVQLASNSSLPFSYGIDEQSESNGTHVSIHMAFNTVGMKAGGSELKGAAQPVPPHNNSAAFSTWKSGPLPPINYSLLLPFSLQAAYDYGLNHTTLAGFLAANSSSFVSQATYNYTLSEWSVIFSTTSGAAYSLNVSDIGGYLSASGEVVASYGTYAIPFGSSILQLQSAYSAVMNSSYSNYFSGASGGSPLASLSFVLNASYLQQISPLLPPPLQHAEFAFIFRTATGAVAAVDAGNGQLMYLGTGMLHSLV